MRLDEHRLAAWGETVGAAVARPAFFALRGDLGAGKSVLARAIARGAGVTARMPSPTFNLLYRYDTPTCTVTHLDLYRLERADEVWELGWRELPSPDEIVLVEWPERAEALLPPQRYDVTLGNVPGEPMLRELAVEPRGGAGPLPGSGAAAP
jgi:tRNA threonylcarbamoyladenosine biosynthesis protein TsaE